MKFTVNRESLVKALSIVGKALSSRPQIPVLSNILIKAEENSLSLSTTNLEMGIKYTTGAKIENKGEITIPGRILTDYINTLKSNQINFELKETNIYITTDNTSASFTTISAQDFPSFPKEPEKKDSLPFEKVKQITGKVIFAASNDETKPILTGVKITVKEDSVTLTATDGYRLSINSVDIPNKTEDLEIVVPAQSLGEVFRIAGEGKSESLNFAILKDKNQIIFTLPSVTVYTRIIDGEYPNVEKIIPSNFKTRVRLEKESFYQSVKSTSLFAKGAANIIKMKIDQKGVTLSANTPQVGENKEFIPAKTEGEEMEAAFNYRFLLDLLANFPEEEIVFESSGPLLPGVFKNPAEPSYLHIIMPVRVQD